MSIFKPRRLLAGSAVILFLIGGYAGWQVYQGQQLANQYAADTEKLAQTPGLTGTSSNTGPSNSTSLSRTAPSPSSSTPLDAASNPSGQASPSAGSAGNSSSEYKTLMSRTYQQTLQTMQAVKGNTLALQGRKLSLSVYRSKILQSQAAFSSAEEFVRANPPAEQNLTSSYQEFLTGISLAKESMGVVLNGISSLSPSKFYAAREMGKRAQQQVISAFSQF